MTSIPATVLRLALGAILLPPAAAAPAAPPALAEALFNQLLEAAKRLHPSVESGRFGADMQVHLINDGPVTFLLQT